MSLPQLTGETGVELFMLRSPLDQMKTSPELFAGEWITYSAFVFGLWHACKNGPESRLFIAVLFAAASFVDPFCLISEQIRNYYHSHASILVYDRHVAPWQFPLFADIGYVGGAVVWALGIKNMLAEACLVAVVAGWTFYSFDLLACRWLLYQWHNSDPLYLGRTGQCVPLASSMWVMCYAFTGSLLARWAGRRLDLNDFWTWIGAFFALTLAFLPLHVVPIAIFYFPPYALAGREYEAVWGFLLLCLGYGLAFGRTLDHSLAKRKVMVLAALQSIVWFGGIAAVGVLVEPGNVVSTCVHEPFGTATRVADPEHVCDIKETYLYGLGERPKYLCDPKFWKVIVDPKTGKRPQFQDDFYTIQGLPMDPEFRAHYFGSIAVGVALHILVLIWVLWGSKSASREAKSKVN